MENTPEINKPSNDGTENSEKDDVYSFIGTRLHGLAKSLNIPFQGIPGNEGTQNTLQYSLGTAGRVVTNKVEKRLGTNEDDPYLAVKETRKKETGQG